jgi:alkaline phosphatase/alkaline phosphatase D
MHPIRSVAEGVLVTILVLVFLAVGGCGPASHEMAAELVHDPLDYAPVDVPEPTAHWQGEMAGEVTQDSVILQARLTKNGKVRSGDVEGRPGLAAFALSTGEEFADAYRTRWIIASPDGDHIVKTQVTGLEPSTRYYYRLLSGPDVDSLAAGPTGTFRTLDAEGTAREIRFVAVTGLNQFAFQATTLKDMAFRERALGFPALATIASHQPDFFVATGDSVYYDTPFLGRGKERDGMRAKWHRQFATPRFAALFQHVPAYWEKDDHDYRYDDADPYGSFEPSAELGAEIFLEQVPVVDPNDENPRTYRTHRINDLLQIWLLEGRDYRDPNTVAAGPEKTLWGTEQKEWLKRTLLESDATFKILVSPTPMIGPDDNFKGVQGGFLAPYFGGRPLGQGDDGIKRDNHTNPHGFRDEGDAFFDWLSANGFLDKSLYIVCGDRHWQYHSIHPEGFEEFSVGAVVDANSRLGRKPGDPESTDPEGLIYQPYLQEERSGGFLEVTVRPPTEEQPATAEFAFYDEKGTLLYTSEKAARP